MILRSKMHRPGLEDIRRARLCIARNNLPVRRNATGRVSMFCPCSAMAWHPTVQSQTRFFRPDSWDAGSVDAKKTAEREIETLRSKSRSRIEDGPLQISQLADRSQRSAFAPARSAARSRKSARASRNHSSAGLQAPAPHPGAHSTSQLKRQSTADLRDGHDSSDPA